MKNGKFLLNMSRSFHKFGFKIRKHSPEIMVVAGVVGVVVSAVAACKATTKVHSIVDEAKEKIDVIHEGAKRGEVVSMNENGEEEVVAYSEEDSKKDLSIVYAKAGLQFVKLYGPSVLLGAVSIASILGGHNILRKRNIALAAAYATVDQGFKEYRTRLIERFGEDLDRELRYNIKAKEIEETVVDEDGNETIVKRTVQVANPNAKSIYARCFDEFCTGYTKDWEYNFQFLKLQESYANKKLQQQGYLFLNDVYEMLGFDKTKAGHVVGWIYDEKNPVGDNYVDFGLYRDTNDEALRDFLNGRERAVWLDFNVDGDVWSML